MQGPPPPQADPRLLAAIEDVYAVLRAPNPRVIEGCPCCIGKGATDTLLTTPLREIPAGELYSYITGVFFTVGGPRDFRYLAPRILEAAVLYPDETPTPEVALGKLRLAEWDYWADAERAAIVALIGTWFDNGVARDIALLGGGAGGFEADMILCGAARAGLDIAPWLSRLAEPQAQAVRAHLAAFYARDIQGGLAPGFWEDAPGGWAAFVATILAA